MGTGTEPDGTRTIRIRVYLGRVYDVKRTYSAPDGADLTALLKRGALAILPKAEGWRLLVISVARTNPDEPIVPVLDRLIRRLMGTRDFAAALAATSDGAQAVLAVGAKDAVQIERMRAAFAAMGR